MTSPIRFQVNSVRSIGSQGSKREPLAPLQPNLGVIGRVVPVEAPNAVRSAWASTQRDPGERTDEFARATQPPSARDNGTEEQGAFRKSSVPIAIPFVALQRAVAVFGETRLRDEEPVFRPSESAPAESEEVDASTQYEDPFQLAREHLQKQADEGEARDAKLKPTLFDLPKEPAKPFGRARLFESEPQSEPQSGSGLNRRANDTAVAEAALRGAIAQGLAGVGLPPRVTKKSDDTGAAAAVPASTTPSDAGTSPFRWSSTPGDGGIRIPRGAPRAEIASSQYRAVEDNDYAKLLAVPGDAAAGGRWSRIGATLPTFAFSVSS